MIRHIIQAALTTAAVAVMLVGGQQAAEADQVYDFVVPNGTNLGGNQVGGTAHFVVSAGSVTVTLTNTFANPTSAAQLISGIQFSASGQTANETLSASNYQGITINQGGTYSNTAVDPLTRWGLIAPSINLTTLTGGNPNMLIIGPPGAGNLYSNANTSITGNGNPNSGDNPSLAQSVTFTITDPGITGNSVVSGVSFEFGTGPSYVTVLCSPVVPEPSSLALIGCGGIAYALRSVRRRKPSVSPSH